MKSLIQNFPKAELYLHIEGTLEPEFMFDPQIHTGRGIAFEKEKTSLFLKEKKAYFTKFVDDLV